MSTYSTKDFLISKLNANKSKTECKLKLDSRTGIDRMGKKKTNSTLVYKITDKNVIRDLNLAFDT